MPKPNVVVCVHKLGAAAPPRAMVPESAVRRANLVEVLSDSHPSCPPPPEDAHLRWSEARIRSFFASGGVESPSDGEISDVDGSPLSPSTRPDGMYVCQRIGCDAIYDALDGNPAGCCRHHPGAPVFHDGVKEWSCCGGRSHDFALFMEIKGCAVGRHTQVKPEVRRAARSPNAADPAAAPIPLPLSVEARAKTENGPGHSSSSDAASKASCPRCKQGFFCSDHAASAEAQAAYVAPQVRREEAPAKAEDVDPHAPRTCRNAGCGAKYTEAENGDDRCLFHPGPPVFHERKKGWSCCDVHVYDFDEFMNVPPCTRGRHCADPPKR